MQQLQGKITVVTGAGRGIGRAVAQLFAAEGATVFAVSRTAHELNELAREAAGASGKLIAMPGDITKDEFIATLFDDIAERFGRLDVLVNNAGIAPFGPVDSAPIEELRAVLELNITAVFNCSQRAIRLMRKTNSGKIINIGSVRSHWTESGDCGFYNASKFGLRGLTESIARQLHNEQVNIAVGMVSPGVVDTPLTNPNREPRPGWLKPETVARAVLNAATAPPDVNVFETILFSTAQTPW